MQHGADGIAADLTTTVVDVGVATPLPPEIEHHPALWARRVRAGTDNLAVGPDIPSPVWLFETDVLPKIR